MTPTTRIDREALKGFMGPDGDWAKQCGLRVRKRRELLLFSLADLARYAETTLQTISRVERGELVPRDHLKGAIALALLDDMNNLWPWPTREDMWNRSAEAA